MGKTTEKKLHVGVIGLGIGRGHVNNFQQHPLAEVVAVADPDQERLDAVTKKFNVPSCYTDVRTMLAKETLDVVSVATPNKLHKEQTIAALNAGCHVLCEKPMARNAAEAHEMNAAAKKAGRRLMINFSYRFNEQSWALKKAVDEGALGNVYFARTQWLRRRGMPGFGGWFGQKAQSGGGPLIDLGVHRLDLALWLMDYPKPAWVLGSTYDPIASRLAAESGQVFDVEDMAVAMIKFENGASLELEASWAGNIREKEFMSTQLFGTEGGLVQRNIDEGYQFEAELYVQKNGCQYDMKLHPPVPQAQSPMYHFIDSIVNDTPHIAAGEEGVVVMELLDAVYQSADQGAPVKLN